MVSGGWYICPRCGKKLIRIPPDAVLYGVPVYCRACKQEWLPTIWQGRELDGGTFDLPHQDK